jgi:hypothetical protein
MSTPPGRDSIMNALSGAAHGVDLRGAQGVLVGGGMQVNFYGQAAADVVGILSFHRRLARDYEHRLSSSASRVYWR